MDKEFNTTGLCVPELHYMVDITSKLIKIKELIDKGSYFTINRARQYGKTTTISSLEKYLQDSYIVLSLDFQSIGDEEFTTASDFSIAFSESIIRLVDDEPNICDYIDMNIIEQMRKSTLLDNKYTLRRMFTHLRDLCKTARKPIVLIIDEVDSATNNQVFLDFLAQLRFLYLERAKKKTSTFQSVILAGVYDVKNVKRKIRPDEQHKVNSPWNIATDFLIDMSFSKDDIFSMLNEYEMDHNTGMDKDTIAQMIYDSTSGYPFLVSRLCQLIDRDIAGTEAFPDKVSAWTREGFIEAEKKLLSEENTLFDSLIGKVKDHSELRRMLCSTLFNGEKLTYNPDNTACQLGSMFGFIKNKEGILAIANRIFETRLYNYFMSEEQLNSASYKAASKDKNQFVQNGVLNMDLVLQKFVEHFEDVYGDKDEAFVEEYGRKFFLLYLKPIINGVGHYYIEAQTRDATRTDVIVDYRGKQYVIEMKIWRGQQYHDDGEDQLVGYLEHFHLDKGYMLTFSFVHKKKVGIVEVEHLGKKLIEATV